MARCPVCVCVYKVGFNSGITLKWQYIKYFYITGISPCLAMYENFLHVNQVLGKFVGFLVLWYKNLKSNEIKLSYFYFTVSWFVLADLKAVVSWNPFHLSLAETAFSLIASVGFFLVSQVTCHLLFKAETTADSRTTHIVNLWPFGRCISNAMFVQCILQ